MNATLQAAIDAGIAAEARVIDPPSPPFAYGSDLDCATDLTERMAENDGTSTVAISQALVRRFTTPRGGLPDDDDYGLDVRAFLNRGTTTTVLRSIAGQMRSEGTKDDRVDSMTVTVSPSNTGQTLDVRAEVVPADPAVDAFTLTLAVTSLEVIIMEID